MLTLLTPTRNRRIAFSLLESYIARQSYRDFQWIVVNDGTESYDYTQGQEVVTRFPKPGEPHSLCANLLAGIPCVRGSAVVIVEDDDWLAPTYLSKMAELLGEADLAGFAPAHYYNLCTRRLRILRNERHCSLGQSGMRLATLPLLAEICREGRPSVDLQLWRRWSGSRKVCRDAKVHVGIKCMPGERGIGSGHRSPRGTLDSSFRILRRLIGEFDSEPYVRISRTIGEQNVIPSRSTGLANAGTDSSQPDPARAL